MRLPLLFGLLATGCGTYYVYETEDTVYGSTDIGQPPVVNETRGAMLTVEIFYQALAPYGEWIAHPELGYVWAPYDPSYVPYTNGHWEYTDAGFTWISKEPFGWAVCHYGRWVVVDEQWLWVPGTEWGPAWVVWREGVEIAGWAPMPPEGWGEPPRETFVFVDVSYLFVTEIHQHYFAGWTAYDAYASTVWVDERAYLPGGIAYCPGPSADGLRRRGVEVRVTTPDARRTGRVIARTAADGSVHVRRPGHARPTVAVRRPSATRDPIEVSRPRGPRPRVEVRRAPIVIAPARVDPSPVEPPPPARIGDPPVAAPVAVERTIPEPTPVEPPRPSFGAMRDVPHPTPVEPPRPSFGAMRAQQHQAVLRAQQRRAMHLQQQAQRENAIRARQRAEVRREHHVQRAPRPRAPVHRARPAPPPVHRPVHASPPAAVRPRPQHPAQSQRPPQVQHRRSRPARPPRAAPRLRRR